MKKRFLHLFLVLAAICTVILAGAAFAKEEGDPKDIVVEDLSRIRSDNPDFTISIKPASRSGKFCIGEEAEFTFTSSQDAYLTIIDIGTSGKVHVIFPNKRHKDNKVKAGKKYRIPVKGSDFVFKVRGPEGVNYIKAIGTLKPFRCFPDEALLYGKGPFPELRDPVKAVKDLAVELRKQDAKGWTEAETNFTIVRRCEPGEDDDRRIGERERGDWIVKLWTDRKSYKPGAPVSFFFYSERDCYLNLVDYGTSGKVRIIFPNRYQKDNFIKGGEVVEIPAVPEDEFLFRVQGPPGKEMIKAVVMSHKYHIYSGAYDWDKYCYQPWDEKAETIDKDIEVQLQDMPDEEYIRTKTTFKVLP